MNRKPCQVLLCVSLCVSAAIPALAGEAQWSEVRSPNFRVYTDAGEKRGREVALHFEQMRFVFGQMFQKAKIQTGVPVYVIAFRNTKEFRSVAPLWKGKAKEIAGFFLQGRGAAFIAVDLSSPQGWKVVFHEYAHLLLNSNLSSAPVWFDEGFAEYYSTARIEKSEWVIGELPEYAPQQLASARFIPLEQLFSAGHDSPLYNERDHTSMFYAQSWLAVEYFWFDPARNKQLVQYFELLDEQASVPEAMKRAFGREPAELDKDLLKYFRGGKVRVTHFKSPPALDNLEMKARGLDDLEARAIASELRLNEQDYRQQAVTELEAILQQNPDEPVALRALGYHWQVEGDSKKSLAYLDRAAALGSDDARVYFYWALALEHDGGRLDGTSREKMKAALERSIALNPQMAEAYSLLAFVKASQNDFEAAVQCLKTAITLSPRTPEHYLNLANLLLSRQKFDEAAALLQPLTHNANEAVAAQARTVLATIEQMKKWRTDQPSAGTRLRMATGSTTSVEPEVTETEDFELKTFAGTLSKVDCSSPARVIITVDTGRQALILSGETKAISFGKKPFYCDLRGVKVHGYYNAKKSTLVALTVE